MSAKDIQRLAGAAYSAAFKEPMVLPRYDEWNAVVRAILQALREPSEEMVEAGEAIYRGWGPYAAPTWQAMIDHILAD